MTNKPVTVDRKTMKGFLDGYLKSMHIEIPEDVSEDALVEMLCDYVESDYYEWFNDNLNSFFGGHIINYRNPDWSSIKLQEVGS